MDNNNLGAIIRRAEDNLTQGNVQINSYVNHNLFDTVERIDAYLNDSFIDGDTDSLGRPKPFFNLVTATANTWWRATDIDRKFIKFIPSGTRGVIQAYAAYALLQNWMRKNNFANFLNRWGLSLARYGSSVVKFVEKDGELIPSVIPWNRLIVDPVDFYALPRIEKLYKTPAQLKDMATKGHPDYVGLNEKVVEELLGDISTRKNLSGNQKDNVSEFIEIYEVHGKLSKVVYQKSKNQEPKDEDKNIFFQQMHIVCFTKNESGKFDDFTLYSGKESEDPYMITHLIEEDGRTLGKGAVEILFNSQWMMNHSMKNMKDYLDLASKLLFQTSDENLLDRNVLTSVETGSIFVTKQNQGITQISNTAQNISSIMAFANQWNVGSKDMSSTPDAYRGNPQPSGATATGTLALQQQSASLFELMTENKATYLIQMLRKFVIPNLKKSMNKSEEISAILRADDIRELDAAYVPDEAVKRYNQQAIDQIIQSKGQEIPEPFNPEIAIPQVQQSVSAFGNKRFFKPEEVSTKTWEKALKDFEWEVEIDVTGEGSDKRDLFIAINSFLQTVRNNPLMKQAGMEQSVLPQQTKPSPTAFINNTLTQ